MTTSSQTISGAQPPQQPHGPQPLTACDPVTAATGVIAAAMDRGLTTPRELAQAEHDTGILFDPQRAQDIAAAAAEQAHAEDQAELAERGRQLAAMAGDHRRITAVRRLLEGRPGTDLLTVAEIASAAEYGTTPYDSAPMTLRWTGAVHMPPAHDTPRRAIVECVSSHGGRADLVVEGDDRVALASLVDADLFTLPAPCPTDGCGTLDDYDASDPAMAGWVRVEFAGVEDSGPRWYCSPMCVSAALARAGAELAAADEAAAVDPDEQGYGPLYGGDVVQFVSDAYDGLADQEADAEHVARCERCGCTEDAACEGGCAWVPNTQLIDLCSACATPAELEAAGGAVSGG